MKDLGLSEELSGFCRWQHCERLVWTGHWTLWGGGDEKYIENFYGRHLEG
jgi:hypothetical protein